MEYWRKLGWNSETQAFVTTPDAEAAPAAADSSADGQQ
jgi:hypothetical protein